MSENENTIAYASTSPTVNPVALCKTCGRYFALCLATSSEIVDAVARVTTVLRSLARSPTVLARITARASSRVVLDARLALDASAVPPGQLLRRIDVAAAAATDADAGRANGARACIIVDAPGGRADHRRRARARVRSRRHRITQWGNSTRSRRRRRAARAGTRANARICMN